MGPWAYLGLAIAAEVVATSALKASEGFSRFWPSALGLAQLPPTTYRPGDPLIA